MSNEAVPSDEVFNAYVSGGSHHRSAAKVIAAYLATTLVKQMIASDKTSSPGASFKSVYDDILQRLD